MCLLTGSKPCAQAHQKLSRGIFGQLKTFMSTVSRYRYIAMTYTAMTTRIPILNRGAMRMKLRAKSIATNKLTWKTLILPRAENIQKNETPKVLCNQT